MTPPNEIFPGMTADATTFTLPVSIFANHNMTSATVDPTTGNGEQMIMSILGRMFEWYNDKVAPKPTNAVLAFRSSSVAGSGNYQGKLPVYYNVNAFVNYPEGSVADEAP